MRYYVILAVCVLVVCALSSVEFQIISLPFDDVTRNATASVSYNDTRPAAPNGYLCVYGAKGRLNNLILQNLVGIHMAHHLNRTLLVDPEVSKYYDIDQLSLTTYADSPYLAAVPIEKSGHAACGDPKQISPHAINHGLNIPQRFDDYGSQTKDLELASVDNSDIWYWLGRPPEEVYGKYFRGLIPRQVYLDKVHAFLKENELLHDRNPYNAVHLRSFEGKCGHNDLDLCCPKLTHTQEILIERGGSIMDPLFVANDGQCAQDVLRSYDNATDPVIMGYDQPCDGTECAVLDFELCVRSEVFVGNLKSSGDMNIREWRMARYGISGWKSVLSRQAEAFEVEKRSEFMTRYIVGHWRFRPDCDTIGPQKRGKPCV